MNKLKKSSSRGKKFSGRVFKVLPGSEAVAAFLESLGGKERKHLTALWDNWQMVMGPEIAALGLPLGAKDSCLTICADDPMALQELSLHSPEILERANAFMDCFFFKKITVTLPQGRRALSEPRQKRNAARWPKTPLPRPPRLGSLSDSLNPDSPVTKCYLAYIALFEQGKKVRKK